MGHKGVSIRKPKRPFSNADIHGGNAKSRADQHSPVQSLMEDKGAPLVNRGDLHPAGGSHKSPKKR